jgi:DNA invertase Pin-like site-specific DNA recombinase
VNPEHLRIGANADNVADMMKRGRHVITYGSRHPRAKLTEALVVEIRARYARGEERADIARAFGVSWDLIDRICRRGVAWRHTAGLSPSGK